MRHEILVYADEVTKRLNYTLEVIGDARGISFSVTNDALRFLNYPGIKVNYSNFPFEAKVPTLPSSDLLFQEDLRTIRQEKKKWQNTDLIAFDGVPDILASIFFIVTCYDEYLATELDKHGRMLLKNKTIYKFGWHRQLIVERWSLAFIRFIENENNTKIGVKEIPFRVVPTFDIDNTFAFKLKEGPRKWLSISRDWLKRDKERILLRKDVLEGNCDDPYDTFDKIKSIAKRGFPVHVFWLVGSYAQYDRNISIQNAEHRQVIHKLSEHVTIGIHPSYRSHASELYLRKEKEDLEELVSHRVNYSRQHFLKFRIPTTYEHLLNVGITDDFTMGFAEDIGFRMGLSRPIHWFNLRTNTKTKLVIHPFTYMDGTLLEYQHWDIENSKKEIQLVKDEVKRFGGDFIFIWHNETIGDYGKWKGWSDVLDFSLGED